MSFEEIKKEGEDFFWNTYKQWNRLIEIVNKLTGKFINLNRQELINEATIILLWLQDNYVKYRQYSSFNPIRTLENGKEVHVDPIFDVLFNGGTIEWIINDLGRYAAELNQGPAHLRAHLASIKRLKKIPKEKLPESLNRLKTILNRFHVVANQLKKRRKDKAKFSITDEYDVQNLLHALLKIDFYDIKKEQWTPSYAGASCRIDFVLKKCGIAIEIKKTRKDLRDGEIGNQLLIDIVKYAKYPGVNTLICFIYDPENWIENPDGLIQELEQQSKKNLKVEIIIQPK